MQVKYTAEYYITISENVFAPIYKYLAEGIINRIDYEADELIILDLGGGSGKWLLEMLKNNIKYGVLADIDYEMVDYARNYLAGDYPNTSFVVNNADKLPFKNNTFNLIISRSSMHMWPNLQLCWDEMFRVLNKGGYAYLGRGYGPDLPDSVREKVKRARKELREGLYELRKNELITAKKEEPPSPPAGDIIKMAKKAGFERIEIIKDNKAYWVLAKK